MAIDSEQKRKSAATVCNPWNGPTVIPTGGFDQADRQHIGWSYTGILAGGGPPAAAAPRRRFMAIWNSLGRPLGVLLAA